MTVIKCENCSASIGKITDEGTIQLIPGSGTDMHGEVFLCATCGPELEKSFTEELDKLVLKDYDDHEQHITYHWDRYVENPSPELMKHISEHMEALAEGQRRVSSWSST